jgi:tetratricopeptide (TPR) repeat protein
LYVDRGDILAGKGDLIGAEAAYKQAIRLDPKNVAALNNAAWLLADRGAGLDEALDFARRATTLQPENALLSDTLGWVYRARKDFSNAIKAFERAIKLAPKLPEPHYHLGLALTDAGKAADARAEFERALKLGLGEPQASDARKRVALNTAR